MNTFKEYENLAMRTASPRDGDGAVDAGHDILHAGLGLATESGEILDVLKKNHAYDKPLDLVNLREELGDALWYIALGARALGITLDEIASVNIAKLSARYPDRFSASDANDRDLARERVELESGTTMVAISMKSKIAAPEFARVILGGGLALEQRIGKWQVMSGSVVLAETGSDGRTLSVTGDGSDGPWFFAAQSTLNQILHSTK